MGNLHTPVFTLLLICFIGILSLVDSEVTDIVPKDELEATTLPTVSDPPSTTSVTILSERPVTVSQMQNPNTVLPPAPAPVPFNLLNQPEYYSPVPLPQKYNIYPNLEYIGPRGKPLPPGLPGLPLPYHNHHHQYQNPAHQFQKPSLQYEIPSYQYQNPSHQSQNHQYHAFQHQQHRNHQHLNRQHPNGIRQSKAGRFPALGLGESIDVMGILRNFASQQMEYMQRLRNIKYNFKDQEQVRRMEVRNPDNGDFMTRLLRGLIQKCINKFQKHTAMLEMTVQFRKQQLQTFLEIPLVTSVLMGSDNANYYQEQENIHGDSAVQAVPHGRKMLDRLPSFL